MGISGCGFTMGVWKECVHDPGHALGQLLVLFAQMIVNKKWRQPQANQEKATKGSDCSVIRSRSWTLLFPQAWDPDHQNF